MRSAKFEVIFLMIFVSRFLGMPYGRGNFIGCWYWEEKEKIRLKLLLWSSVGFPGFEKCISRDI